MIYQTWRIDYLILKCSHGITIIYNLFHWERVDVDIALLFDYFFLFGNFKAVHCNIVLLYIIKIKVYEYSIASYNILDITNYYY